MPRPGFSFLVCDDSAILKEEIEGQIRKNAPEAVKWKRLLFWGDEEPDERFWSSLDQAGLFEENRIIVVRKAELLSAQIWQEISNRLSRQLAHAWPFFCLEIAMEGREQKAPAAIQKLPCWGYAAQKKWIWRQARKDIRAKIRQAAKDRGLSFDGDCFEAFAAFVENCHWQQTLGELDKLALLANDGVVTRALFDTEQIRQQNGAFQIVNAIRSGDLHGALQEATADTDGGMLFFAIAVLDRELRDKWKKCLGAGSQSYRSSQTKELSPGEISRGFAALAAAEWQVKSGRLAPAQALESLCQSMCALFR